MKTTKTVRAISSDANIRRRGDQGSGCGAAAVGSEAFVDVCFRVMVSADWEAWLFLDSEI
jgi:hypothetical protein